MSATLFALILVVLAVPSHGFVNFTSLFSAATSSVVCVPPTTVVAGQLQYCTVTVRNSGGTLIGDNDVLTTCQLRLTYCTNAEQNGWAPVTVQLSNATFVSTGIYRFYWYPTIRGTHSVKPYASRNAFTAMSNLTVTAAPAIDPSMSTSVCTTAANNGLRTCVVSRRDRYGNFISTCTFTYTAAQDGALSSTSTCSMP
eukprot:GILI01023237.1.p1 GENE.GILI01023237.1~~GILI01023237.1.p1  ORF type:complete len:198 (+),score=21.62 GILI01023237.1:67-660(+)